MLERKNELDAALGDSSQNYAAQFGSLTFIPNKTLQVSAKSFNGVHKFFLNLNSVNFAEINENTDENPHIISLIERGAKNLHAIPFKLFIFRWFRATPLPRGRNQINPRSLEK